MARKLSGGHSESVLCLENKDDLLVSGGETGELCLWDLRSEVLVHKVSGEEDCTSVAISKILPDRIYASFGQSIRIFDTRNLNSSLVVLPACDEEINQIVLNDKEEFLAACEDTGNIKVFTVRNSENKIFKTLRNKHTNICSTATFRPGKPWDLISGGFDSRVIHWDFAKLKSLNIFNIQELLNDPNADSLTFMVNPPFVHHMDMSPGGAILGCGLGNGGVLIFDASKRHLKQTHFFQGHLQGVSQIHFVNASKFLTGSNDEQILVWDLNTAPGDEETYAMEHNSNGNGADSLAGLATPTDNVVVHRIDHSHKVNWLKPIDLSGHLWIAVADQRPEITLHTVI